MKITYPILNGLYNLLHTDNWQQFANERIEQINKELLTSPEEKFNLKLEEIKSKNKTLGWGNAEGLLKSYEKQSIKLESEKEYIQSCLQKEEYPLGVFPFERKENASFLLAHADVLETDSDGYSLKALSALKKMLQSNFQNLFTSDIYPHIIETKHTMIDKDEIIFEKIISGEEITFQTLKDIYFSSEENEEEPIIPDEAKEKIEICVKNLRFVNKDIILYANKKLQFFQKFYSKDLDLTQKAIMLSLVFNNSEGIDKYLENDINYLTGETIENSLLPQEMSFPIDALNKNNLQHWYKLNDALGNKSIDLFTRIDDLQKIEGYDLNQIISKHGYSEETLNIIQSFIDQIKYAREEEHLELAALCKKYNFKEKEFNNILDNIIPRQKTSDDLPDIKFDVTIGKELFTIEKLKAGDVTALFLGKMTKCCQFIGGDAEKCVFDSFTQKEAGSYVVKDSQGRIKAQVYAWIGLDTKSKPVIVFDSYEYLPEGKKTFLPIVKKFAQELAGTKFMALYVGTGGQTPTIYNFDNQNNVIVNIITPLNTNLFNYGDSKNTYLITETTKLSVAYTPTLDKNFENYDEMISAFKAINFYNLQKEYGDYFKNSTEPNKFFIFYYAQLLYPLVKNELLDPAKLSSLESWINNENNILDYSFTSNINKLIIEFKNKLDNEKIINLNLEVTFRLFTIFCQAKQVDLPEKLSINSLCNLCYDIKHNLLHTKKILDNEAIVDQINSLSLFQVNKSAMLKVHQIIEDNYNQLFIPKSYNYRSTLENKFILQQIEYRKLEGKYGKHFENLSDFAKEYVAKYDRPLSLLIIKELITPENLIKFNDSKFVLDKLNFLEEIEDIEQLINDFAEKVNSAQLDNCEDKILDFFAAFYFAKTKNLPEQLSLKSLYILHTNWDSETLIKIFDINCEQIEKIIEITNILFESFYSVNLPFYSNLVGWMLSLYPQIINSPNEDELINQLINVIEQGSKTEVAGDNVDLGDDLPSD